MRLPTCVVSILESLRFMNVLPMISTKLPAAVDDECLSRHEIAMRRCQPQHRADEVFRLFRAADGAAIYSPVSALSVTARLASVRVNPGATAFTVTPWSPSSRASPRVIAIMPPLEDT